MTALASLTHCTAQMQNAGRTEPSRTVPSALKQQSPAVWPLRDRVVTAAPAAS
jgi:hypothetical protein